MRFSDIIGHEEIINSLRRTADSGKISHAFLFSGVPGIGKFRTARAFSQYLHCRNHQNGDSCGVCPSCIQHSKHNNPDLHYIYPIVKKEGSQISKDKIEPWKEMLDTFSYMPPEKWNELINAGNSQPTIYVKESEEIINKASLSAYQENLKIFIIWQPEKLQMEAANKLLKIIEEPFEDTVFILVSNNESRILPTILSRTQRVNFHPLSQEEIKSMLIRRGIDAKEAREAARISDGSLQKAEEFVLYPDEINEFCNYFKEIMRAAYALKVKTLKELSEDIASLGREKILRFLAYSQRMIRENYIFNLGQPILVKMTSEENSFSERFAPFIHEGNVEELQKELSRASSDIERNANTKIVMFDLFLLLSRNVRKPKTTEFVSSTSNII